MDTSSEGSFQGLVSIGDGLSSIKVLVIPVPIIRCKTSEWDILVKVFQDNLLQATKRFWRTIEHPRRGRQDSARLSVRQQITDLIR